MENRMRKKWMESHAVSTPIAMLIVGLAVIALSSWLNRG
jgi:hypothetical protein